MTEAERKEFQDTVSRFKTLREQADLEAKNGGISQETKSQLNDVDDRISSLEVKMRRPAAGAGSMDDLEDETKDSDAQLETKRRTDIQHKAAFKKLLRKGRENLNPLELKLMTVSDDTTGGYLAPAEYVKEIIKDMIELSPIRSISRVRTTSFRAVKIPKRTGTPSAQWTGEVERVTESGSKYGLEEVPNHQLTAMLRISNEDLEDSAFDLEAELRSDASEQFALAEGQAFLVGDSNKKPEGILFNPDVPFTVSGFASTLTFDSFIDLYYDLKTMYSRQGTWLLNRGALKTARKLKDGQGQYLWQPNLGLDLGPTILDRPYIETPDMPDVAAGSFPVAFGDFKRGYLITDRLDMSVLRDPYSESEYGIVKLIMRKRVGGQVILPQALRKMKIST